MDERPETGAEPAIRISSTGRIEAFSDGVMAIAITLLVLDLKVPDEAQVSAAGNLVAALLARWPAYLAYLTAFLTVGIIWLNHRSFVDKVNRFDDRLQWLNLALLLGVATLPFPTALMADYVAVGGPSASTATALYGLLAALMGLPWVFMWRHLRGHAELLEPPFGAAYAAKELRRASIGPLIFGLAVPIAIVVPVGALVFYISVAALYAITSGGAPSSPALDERD
ncbi:MAG: TMEM175 family protein [Candidatus Limnocylindrales bacterium]